MKIIIPLNEREGLGSKLCDHFGSAPFFALVETGTGSVEIIDNGNQHHEHGQCTPAESFAGIGFGAVVCNGIGAGAVSRMQKLGIEVYMAALAPTLADAMERFSGGELVKVTRQQVCTGHDCR
jgi:predicted Fe-Mo cluster-binding NifX family protein